MKSLHEAFNELIKQRKWYINSTRTPVQAKNDKHNFLTGGYIPETRMRDYLSSAGWICEQEEKWKKN